MIKINKTDIQNEFYTLFPDIKTEINTYCIASELTILNNGFEYSKMPFYSLPISLMTYITINITNDGFFRLRFQNSDTEYISSCNELHLYKPNGEVKEIFDAIAFSKQKITGACILFSYDCPEPMFKNNKEAVFLAFSLINSNKLPSPYNIMKKSDEYQKNLNSLLYGRKNCLISSDINENIKYLPFDLENKKIILSCFADKKLSVKKSLLNKLSEFQEQNKIPKEVISDYGEKYILNEKERTQKYIKNSAQKENILKPSPYELCQFLKSSQNIKKLLDASYFSQLSCLSFISLQYSSVVSVIEDKNIDLFIDTFRTEAEKIIGRELKFYITDSKDSAIML